MALNPKQKKQLPKEGGVEIREKALIPKKKITDRMFNPDKYSMNFCHGCNGMGKILDKGNSLTVCQICGGFGLIKKRESGTVSSIKPSSA